ncbi:hypothetical protein ES708_01386 [subsurface metagenome]
MTSINRHSCGVRPIEEVRGINPIVLLVYPDNISAALGSPGFKQVYRTLSQQSGFIVDWGWFDEASGRIRYISGGKRKRYDCVAFSVPYELLYFNVVRALISLNIDPARGKRNPEKPSVILGGAAPTLNPAVAGKIADIIYIGEAESGLIPVLTRFLRNKYEGAAQQLTPMIGIPIPITSGAAPRYILPAKDIDSTFLEGFDNPAQSLFKGAGLVEVGRGCSHGCRFCIAGHLYLPTRHRNVDDILHDADTYKGKADRIGLVGAAVSDHRHLKEIMRKLLERGFGLTTSSFRADMIDDECASLLKSGGMKTVTVAPEGGTQYIRTIMNKRISEEEILAAAQSCKKAGIRNLRLYFMIGLPWEPNSHADSIVDLTGKVNDVFGGSGQKITVSVNPFIPKPQTPFQWCGMAESSSIKKAFGRLKTKFRNMKGVTLKTLGAAAAIKEAILSLGDDRVGQAIIDTVVSDIPWKKALLDNGVSVQQLVHTEKPEHYVFPWDTVTGDKTKTALFRSYKKAEHAAQI